MQEMQETQIWSLGQEDSPAEENDNPLQYSCWDNPTDREACWATVPGDTKSQTRLSTHTQWMKSPGSPNLLQHLLLSILWVVSIPVGEKLHLSEVLICVSLVTNDAEHLLVCLWVILKSSLKKHLFKSFVHFFNSVQSILVHTKVLNPEIKFKEGDLESSEGQTIWARVFWPKDPHHWSPTSFLCAPGHHEVRTSMERTQTKGEPSTDAMEKQSE